MAINNPRAANLNNLFSQENFNIFNVNINESKKVMVRNIAEEIPDLLIESLQKECGTVSNWKRTKNEFNKPAPNGFCEFETIEGVLRCMRLLNGMKMFGHSLEIKAFERTNSLIKEFYEMKKQQIMANNSEQTPVTERQIDEEVHSFLSSDDEKVKGKIQKLLENFDQEEFKQKEMFKDSDKRDVKRDRERDRERKRNQIKVVFFIYNLQKEMEKRYTEKLKSWNIEEQEKLKRRQRIVEKEKDNLREKRRALDKELLISSDEDELVTFNNVHETSLSKRQQEKKKKKEQRRKLRQKEFEDDEIDRKKEIMEKIVPPSMEDIMPKDTEDGRVKLLQLGDKLNTNVNFFLDNMKFDKDGDRDKEKDKHQRYFLFYSYISI